MTKEELAERLNDRTIRQEMSPEECRLAKEHHLLVVFGGSDDRAELNGFANDSVDCYDGGDFVVDAMGLREPWDDDEPPMQDDARKFFAREKLPSIRVKAIWWDNGSPGGFAWTYETSEDAARFSIVDAEEGDEPYCEGIVIDCSHLAIGG